MLTKRNAGLTEFIPTPQEKRDGLIRDHVLELVQNLHQRVEPIERGLGLHPSLAEKFKAMLQTIVREETEARQTHEQRQADT